MNCILRSFLFATVVGMTATLGFGTAQAAWDCTAYAEFAISDINKAKAAQCGFGGPQWSEDKGLHFGFCSERTAANDDNAMTQETDSRRRQLTACENSNIESRICPDYAKSAIEAVNEANSLSCGYGGPQWSTDEGLHYGYCIDRMVNGGGDRGALVNETNARKAGLADCKAKTVEKPIQPPTKKKTATVLQDVNVCGDATGCDDNNKIATLNIGDVVTVLDTCPGQTCLVESDKIPGGKGYVYSGDGFISLKF